MLRGRVGRAWRYERNLKSRKERQLARSCWEEIKTRAKRGKALEGWGEERKKFYEEKGWKIESGRDERRRGGN